MVAVEAETRTHTKSSYVVCYYKAIEQPRTVKPASQFLLLLAATASTSLLLSYQVKAATETP